MTHFTRKENTMNPNEEAIVNIKRKRRQARMENPDLFPRSNVGRKPKLSETELQKITELYREYIETTDIPIVVEFAYRMKMRRQTLYEKPEFRELTERASLKKEAAYERGMVTGTMPTAACIFALKQLGWKDHQEVETVVIDKKKMKKELERLFE